MPFAEIRFAEQAIGWLPLDLGLVAEDKPIILIPDYCRHLHEEF